MLRTELIEKVIKTYVESRRKRKEIYIAKQRNG